MKNYDPKNWYWVVGGDATKAYSSALGDYVQAADATFTAWKADGTAPSIIDTEANLGGVLAPYYPNVTRPVTAAILDGYQQSQADDLFQHKLIKLLFSMNNDIRVLKGQQALTVAQARAAFKGIM